MSSPVKLYHQEMHANLGFFGTWLPGDPLQLGDIGVLADGRFRPVTNLTELGVLWAASGKGSPQNLQYTSKSGTALTVRAAADVSGPLPASAEIDIQFSREGAFLFHASHVVNESLADRLALASSVEALYAANVWKKEWYLIESLYKADCGTVVISEDSSAHLVIGAKSSVALGALPLADPHVQLSVSSSKGRMTQVVGGAGAEAVVFVHSTERKLVWRCQCGASPRDHGRIWGDAFRARGHFGAPQLLSRECCCFSGSRRLVSRCFTS